MKRLLLISLLAIAIPASAQQPVNTSTFSGLPAAGTITGNELIPLDQNGVTKKATSSQLTLGSMVIGVGSGGTGLSTVGPNNTVLTSNGSSLYYKLPFSVPGGLNNQIQYNSAGSFAGLSIGSGLTITTSGGLNYLNATATGGGGGGSPGGNTGYIQYNNGSGGFGGYSIGSGLSVVGNALTATATGGGGTPSGPNNAIQYNANGNFGGISTDTLASYAAHDTVMNGLAYDPRNYGAICQQANIFVSDGHTTTYSYTIPFTGSSSTDNTNFFVFYEPSNGGGSATILTTSQFSVTGVNSGTGGTITLNAAPPLADLIFIYHDDGPGIVTAATAAVATGGYLSIPDNCTIYSSQTNGTQLPESAQLVGQGFTPNYEFQDTSMKPILYVIAPTGAAPAFGFNVSGKNKQFFEGFDITSFVPGYGSVAYETVPVLIGANGGSGAGGGTLPGITAQYMTFNYGHVGFGAPVGGNSNYIFATSRFNDYVANAYGFYGPLSDFQSIGDDFVSNQSAGAELGPQQGAPGGRITSDRFEWNNGPGLIFNGGYATQIVNTQFEYNAQCGLLLENGWGGITITGGGFFGNANGGVGAGIGGPGNATAGQDAHICLSGTAGSGGLHLSNVDFGTNYGLGANQPTGTTPATSPLYVLDVTTTGADNDNIEFDQGTAITGNLSQNAYVTDFATYRNGRPPHIQVDMYGQTVQGKIANGQSPAGARGLPANGWSAYYAFGAGGLEYNFDATPTSPAYENVIAKSIGTGATVYAINDFSHFDCDVVNQEIFPNYNPGLQDNPLVTWTPVYYGPGYGSGFYAGYESDTNTCRKAALTWMTVPQQFKVYAQQGTETGAGWTNSSLYGGTYGVSDYTNGDSLALTTTTNGGPIYLWYMMYGNNGGAFTWQLDSTTTGNVSVEGNNSFTYPLSGGSCNAPGTGGNINCQTVGAVRIPVSTTGSHTVTSTLTSTTTTANTVTILGIGTPPDQAYHGSTPAVYLGGQILDADYPTSSAAFNIDQMSQANFLFADGLSVNFVPILNYLQPTDYVVTSGQSGVLNSAGMGHLADAYSSIIQYHRNASRSLSPLDFGASCNTKYLSDIYGSSYALTTTTSSNVISISGYVFQPGAATQTGGGDVGKVISCFTPNDPLQTTYIAAVTTSNNTATLGIAASSNTSGGGHEGCVMGGYPSNPNDPSTAQDDTLAIETASYAANNNPGSINSVNSTGNTGSGVVILPTNCLVHNLILASGSELVGQNGGNNYTINSGNPAATTMYIASTGFNDDVDTATGLPRNVGINVANSYNVKLSNFSIQGTAFPYLGYSGLQLACIGTTTRALDGDNDPEHILIDHMSSNFCPVGYLQPFGWNHSVGFTATTTGTTMDVLSITTSNFNAAVLTTSGSTGLSTDFLAIGRTITGPGIQAGTTITAAPPGGGTGIYSLSLTSSIASSTALTASVPNLWNSATIRNSEFANDGIGINGDLTDSQITDTIFTSNFHVGYWAGPNTGSFGNGSIRMLGGRFEENGVGVVCDSCGIEFTGTDFQFNSGPAILTYGSSNYAVQMNAGVMEGNGAGQTTTASVQVELNSQTGGGSNGNYMFLDGVLWSNQNANLGKQNNYIFGMLGSGADDNAIDLEGGNPVAGYTTALLSPSFTASMPTKYYKQNAPQIPPIDTSQSTFSITTTGGVGIGTATATLGTALDLLSETTTAKSTIGLPQHTTVNRPTVGVNGMFALNDTVSALEFYDQGAWNLLPSVTTISPGIGFYLSSTGTGTGAVWSSGPTLLGYIAGLSLSNDIVTPNTIFDIAPGTATSDDGSTSMTLSSELSKTTSAWVVGGGNGCLDSGTVAASTWYYIFAIERTDTHVVDIACDTSITAPALPSPYTEKRLIGALETTTSSFITKFAQYGTGAGTTIAYATPLADVSTALADTASHLETLTVPPGLNVRPYGNYTMSGASAILWSTPGVYPGAPSATIPFASEPGFSALEITSSGYVNTNLPYIVTNISGQVALQATASTTTVAENTFGYQVDLTQQVPLTPTVNYSFTNGTLPSALSFSRTTTGWYFNSSGNLTAAGPNTPRYDYGTPGSSQIIGLLLEPTRTNQLLYSRDLTQAAWTTSNTTVAHNLTGIDGVANSASTVTATSNNGTICQTITQSATASMFSVYLQRVSGSGTISITQDGGSTYLSVTTTSSWQRFANVPESTLNPEVCVEIGTSGDEIGVDVAQLENTGNGNTGCQNTSPIVTTTTAVTRSGDSMSYASPPWFNPNGGAYVVEFQPYQSLLSSPKQNIPTVVALGASTNGYTIAGNGGNWNCPGTSGSGMSGTKNSASANYAGLTYSAPGATFDCVLNGTLTFGSNSLLSTANLEFGGNFQGFNSVYIQNFTYWPYPLTSAQLASQAP